MSSDDNKTRQTGGDTAPTRSTEESKQSRIKKMIVPPEYYRKLKTLLGFENHDITKERRPGWTFGIPHKDKQTGKDKHLINLPEFSGAQQFVYPKGYNRRAKSLDCKPKPKTMCNVNRKCYITDLIV
jgi:hypothetical protein